MRLRPFVALLSFCAAVFFPALPCFGAGSPNAASTTTPAGARPTASAAPGQLPPAVTAVTAVEGIEEYRLDNGLRVLLFPDPSKQTVTVNITYLVGSRDENYGETGMAHLIEHMIFKGSRGHRDIPAELTAHGCRPNGSTWFDRTNYFETMSATDENLRWALDLEADRMVNSLFDKKDFDSEMTVVRNEFEVGENNPAGVLDDRVMSTAYLWHNYGKSTIGARSDIENVPIERLRAFYKTWYQPDNAILVVGGNFDRGKTLGWVVEKFGSIPKPDRVLPALYTQEPAQDGERTVTLKRVGDVQLVRLAYHIPAGSDPDFAACEVLAWLLGDTPSGRLYKGLVETRKASSVSSWAMQFHDPGVLMLNAEVRKESPLDEVKDGMIRIAEGVADSPPSAEEVERARQALLSEWESSMRNSERAAIGLSEWAAMGDWRLLFLHRDRLQKVAPRDVQRVAAAYLRPANRTVGLYIPTAQPERVEIPPVGDFEAALRDYQGGTGLASGEEFDTSPASIEAQVVRTQLASGLKVVCLPKKTRASTVQISLSLHFGDEQSLRNQAEAGEMAADMLLRGTQAHTRQQIQDELDRLRARLRLWGSASGLSAGMEITREHLDDGLRLLSEILRQPSFADSEFETLKQERLAGLESSRTDPQRLGMTALQKHLNPWPKEDVRYVASPEEEIERVQATSLSQVQDFYRGFYGASAGEICLVGDFDPKAVHSLLSDLLGDWKNARPYTRLASDYADIAPIDQKIETPDKESAVFQAGLVLPLRDDDPDYPALVLGNFMTGGGFLNSRLATRIRRTEGLSYGVGSFFYAGAFDKRAWFGAHAIYAPQNSDKLMTAFREEMEKVVKDGFTSGEVEAAKSGWLQSRQVSRSSERELARTLASRAYEDRTLAWDAQLEEKVASLTPEQIGAAMRKYIDPARISIVQAGDFSRPAPAGAAATPASHEGGVQ